MEMYNRDELNNRLNELDREEEDLKRALMENSNSLSSEEMERIKNNLIGVRSEKGEISHLLSGGFY